ncbi:MAG TPA: hypothetical protein VMZ04_07355 [Anaerolineae bacterium]|nr:hypothetical protein [Anaerolineae bacterium]
MQEFSRRHFMIALIAIRKIIPMNRSGTFGVCGHYKKGTITNSPRELFHHHTTIRRMVER